MGNNDKKNLFQAIKSGVEEGQTAVTEFAREQASNISKLAEAGADGMAQAAKSVSNAVGDFTDNVADKTRELLDEAHAKRRPAARDRLKTYLTSSEQLTPEQIISDLQDELTRAEKASGSESDLFVTAAADYVVTVVELYGDFSKDPVMRQKLIDAVLVLDSQVSRLLQEFGGLALELVAGRVQTAGKILKLVKKASSKISKFNAVAQKFGVENVGTKSAAWVVVRATENALGTPPPSTSHLAFE